jgi:DNA-binding transcriptional regulator YhcF (GntR family)
MVRRGWARRQPRTVVDISPSSESGRSRCAAWSPPSVADGGRRSPLVFTGEAVVGGIVDGSLVAGSKLPTVRQLAGDLGVATNTVAKAYRQLEAEGHVATLGRGGTVIQQPSAEVRGEDELQAAAVLLARAAQRRGLDLSTAIGQLRQAW